MPYMKTIDTAHNKLMLLMFTKKHSKPQKFSARKSRSEAMNKLSKLFQKSSHMLQRKKILLHSLSASILSTLQYKSEKIFIDLTVNNLNAQ
ncbi:CLUMA_CG003863, isoform A [Clunio marinus]|uniref:CLUMA_CG003863, isoform A n=1 Tax=Clunio marinus TaxID=568069 RepID=A0A1J1HQ91_9DIPT|nr:CLUMA_CG003863, isoform A [Clunio marinus]